MNKFKVGDRVRYIEHITKADVDLFIIDGIYTITGHVLNDCYCLDGRDYPVYFTQVLLHNPCEDILQDILDE